MTWTTNSNNKSPFPVFTPNTDFLKPKDIRKDPKYKDVPLIVAPGKEDDYLKEKAQQEAAKQKRQSAKVQKENGELTVQEKHNLLTHHQMRIKPISCSKPMKTDGKDCWQISG